MAEENAKRDGVDLRLYRIIYDCIEEIESAMKGHAGPQVPGGGFGQGRVPGDLQDLQRGPGYRRACDRREDHPQRPGAVWVRDGIIVADDRIASLRRFKDDVKEVADGYDCGITLEKFADIKQGDILEALREWRSIATNLWPRES